MRTLQLNLCVVALTVACGGSDNGASVEPAAGSDTPTQTASAAPPAARASAPSEGAAGRAAASVSKPQGGSSAAAGAGSAGQGAVATAGTRAAEAGAAADGGGDAAGMGGSAAGAGGGGGMVAAAGGAGGSAGMSAPAGSGGSEPGTPMSTQKPVFEKTRCIDPSKLTVDTEINFPCDGVDIWVVLPKQCQEKSCGLIFNIHGGGMTDHATMDQATDMIALGSAADYIVVHPHKGTWNVGQDKDVVFEFMQQVISAFGVDPKRVHSTGYSQGGQISWAIGCEHADVVASIAPTEEINRVADCWKTDKQPARPLSILFAYGKQDSIGGGYQAARTDVDRVVAAHKLMGPETVAGAEGSKYWRQRWTGASGQTLEFISHDYSSTGVGGILAGHCLPMASGDTFVSCSQPVDYDWGKEGLEFFKAHPLP